MFNLSTKRSKATLSGSPPAPGKAAPGMLGPRVGIIGFNGNKFRQSSRSTSLGNTYRDHCKVHSPLPDYALGDRTSSYSTRTYSFSKSSFEKVSVLVLRRVFKYDIKVLNINALIAVFQRVRRKPKGISFSSRQQQLEPQATILLEFSEGY